MQDNVALGDSNDAKVGRGGGMIIDNATVELNDSVTVSDNYAADFGGGIMNFGTMVVNGSAITAPDAALTMGGVRVERNATSAGFYSEGAAIYNGYGDIQATNLVVLGQGEGVDETMAVSLHGGSMVAYNSHFTQNRSVFRVTDGATLSLGTDFLTCDPLALDGSSDPLFAADRYCSEIRSNTGEFLLVVEADSSAFLVTTAIMENFNDRPYDVWDPPTSMLLVWPDGNLELTTTMLGHNAFVHAIDPAVVRVMDGANLTAKQSSFADTGRSVLYESWSTGEFRRNATNYSTSTPAVTVESNVTLTGTCNLGSWDSPTSQPAGTQAPVYWTTTDRGDFHLDCGSVNALDQCSTDGPKDIDGNDRPFSALGAQDWWDIGAIELLETCSP